MVIQAMNNIEEEHKKYISLKGTTQSLEICPITRDTWVWLTRFAHYFDIFIKYHIDGDVIEFVNFLCGDNAYLHIYVCRTMLKPFTSKHKLQLKSMVKEALGL